MGARRRRSSTRSTRDRRNPRYLKDVAIPAAIRATTDLAEALADRELVIIAVPSHAVRDVMARAAASLPAEAILVSAVKGIELGHGQDAWTQVLEEVLPEPSTTRGIAVLSGPSFAREIAQRKPTAVTIACREEAYAIAVQDSLSCPWFRCYSEHRRGRRRDRRRAQERDRDRGRRLATAWSLGHNARAAMMTRGLAEITRLGVRLGANPLTFLGLAGMGDLVLTCTGDLSRNRRVGLELGRGPQAARRSSAGMGEVAEGVRTTYAACELAERVGVEMPIAQGVRLLLEGKVDPREGVKLLLNRQLRGERDWDYKTESPPLAPLHPGSNSWQSAKLNLVFNFA